MNREQLRILANEIGLPAYAGSLAAKDYAAIAVTLNARETVPNPSAQPNVPAQFTWETFLDLLTGAEIWGMYSAGGNFAQDLRSALEGGRAGERNRLWAGLKTVLPAQTATEVEAAFASTIPDPSWSPTVTRPSRAMELGLPVVTENDVLRAAQYV